MTMKVLITGVDGFSGRYLVNYLKDSGEKLNIVGIDNKKNISAPIDEKYNFDLTDFNETKKYVHKIKPHLVFHLAGINFSQNNYDYFNINLIGTINLLQALFLSNCKHKPKILIVGSAAEYGEVSSKNLPINEKTPLSPIGLYALTKMIQELIGLQYFNQNKLRIIRVRTFNIVGPGQSDKFVCGKIIDEFIKVKNKMKSDIELGDLKSVRDFIDIRDAVQAYWSILKKGKIGDVYNIGSGKPTKISKIIDITKKYLNIDPIISTNSTRSLISKSIADINKIKLQIGWSPNISIEKSIRDMINYKLI